MSSRVCLILTVLLAGCSSTGVGNPRKSLELALVADNDQPEPADPNGSTPAYGGSGGQDALVANDGGLVASAGSGGAGEPGTEMPPDAGSLPRGSIETAVLVLGEIAFKPCYPLRGGEERVQRGPFVVDLKEDTTTPEPEPIGDTPGGFCSLVATLEPATEPDGLAGNSIHFQGVRADGTPFILRANLAGKLWVRARGARIWSSENQRLFWALRPRRWLPPAVLAALEPTELADGTRAVVIDPERHPLLVGRIAHSSTLYADVNRDRVFDAGDRAEILGYGSDE